MRQRVTHYTDRTFFAEGPVIRLAARVMRREPVLDRVGSDAEQPYCAATAIMPWNIITMMPKWCKLVGVQPLRPKIGKKSVRVSVTLDEKEYAELTRMATSLDLSAAWMIRRAISEFISRQGNRTASRLPLQPASKRGDARRG